MLALDYNTVVRQTSLDVEQSKKDVSYFFADTTFSIIFKIFSFILTTKQEKISKTLNYQLGISHLLLTDMSKNYENLVNKDWSVIISMLNKLINYNIEIQAELEKFIEKNENNTDFKNYNNEVIETITNLYSCIRLLKKANIKTPLEERSELAIDAVRRTQNTLRTIHAN